MAEEVKDTIKEELHKWDAILDNYECSLGLPRYSGGPSVIEPYLNMSRDRLEKLTPADCGIIAYEIAQYLFYLQRSVNREETRVKWATSTLKRTIADELGQYQGYYEERLIKAVRGNERADKLDKIRIYAQQRVDRLSYLATSLKNIMEAAKQIAMAKREKHD